MEKERKGKERGVTVEERSTLCKQSIEGKAEQLN